MDQKPPGFFSDRDPVLTCLTSGSIEIHVDLSFKRSFFPLAERKCNDIGDVIVVEIAPIDATDELTPDKDNRHLELSHGLIL